MKFGVGQTVKRIEDANLLIGKGQFTDDQLPGHGLSVAFLRSPFAHAKLTHLDLTEARISAGVQLAASQADMDEDNVGEIHCQQYVENRDGSPIPRTTKAAMARDIIRHAGDIVAMVVADTRQQALDAIELIDVDYDILDSVCDVYEATEPNAPQLYDCYPNNTVFTWEAGTIDEARSAIDAAIASGRDWLRLM